MVLVAVSRLLTIPLNTKELIQEQGLYTTLVVCLNVIAGGGGSNLYLPDEFSTFSPLDIQERIKGSKIVIVSEQVHAPTREVALVLLLTPLGYAERHLHD